MHPGHRFYKIIDSVWLPFSSHTHTLVHYVGSKGTAINLHIYSRFKALLSWVAAVWQRWWIFMCMRRLICAECLLLFSAKQHRSSRNNIFPTEYKHTHWRIPLLISPRPVTVKRWTISALEMMFSRATCVSFLYHYWHQTQSQMSECF